MKSILVLLAIISATFAWRNYAQEERWLPKAFLPKLPWDITKNLDFNMEATVQCDYSKQDVFKAGRIYLISAKNKHFLCDSDNNTIIASALKPANSCRFIASIIENGKVSLQQQYAMGNYLYLRNTTIMSNAADIGVLAQFIVEVSSIGPWIGAHYVYLKADNGKYWGLNDIEIEATSSTKETINRMIVMEVL
jgi:hypothetical protein